MRLLSSIAAHHVQSRRCTGWWDYLDFRNRTRILHTLSLQIPIQRTALVTSHRSQSWYGMEKRHHRAGQILCLAPSCKTGLMLTGWTMEEWLLLLPIQKEVKEQAGDSATTFLSNALSVKKFRRKLAAGANDTVWILQTGNQSLTLKSWLLELFRNAIDHSLVKIANQEEKNVARSSHKCITKVSPGARRPLGLYAL